MSSEHPFPQLSYLVLLQYITQKICHDLATPIGALRLGIEHLEENDLTPILLSSLDTATTRIDVFRQLFSHTTDTIDSQRVGKLLHAYLGAKNITLDITGDAKGVLARIMLGLGIVACEALPRGGKIFMDFNDLLLECEGPIIHMPYSHFEMSALLKEDLNFKSGIILFHILFLAEHEKLKLSCQQEGHTLILGFQGQKIA